MGDGTRVHVFCISTRLHPRTLPIESTWQPYFFACVRYLGCHLQRVLKSSTDHARPMLQYRLHQSRDLPDHWAKRVLEHQTKLDSCIGELWASPKFAAGSGKPGQARIQPDRQPTTGSRRGVVLLPVGNAVTSLTGPAHAASLQPANALVCPTTPWELAKLSNFFNLTRLTIFTKLATMGHLNNRR